MLGQALFLQRLVGAGTWWFHSRQQWEHELALSRHQADSARAHLRDAREHLREGTVRLILVGGGPGTGKTTLARGIADRDGAQVTSTDDVRSAMVASGETAGRPGVLGQGLYGRENIEAVYDAVLRRAHLGLCEGHTVILDGTWSDPDYRERARRVAAEAAAIMVERRNGSPLFRRLPETGSGHPK